LKIRNQQPARHLVIFLLGVVSVFPSLAQQVDDSHVINGIDAAVRARDQGVLAYNVTEHYALFRNHDQQHPVAEMTVKTTYQRNVGKTYAIVSESGSELWRREVLSSILDTERRMTQPANRATAVITSANYKMALKGSESLNGRPCLLVSLTPRRNSPYLFNGTIWVDARDYSIVQLDGMASKSASVVTGPAQVTRQYANFNGFPMATHANAVSKSWALGQTTIKIEYTGYEVKLQTPQLNP
jgi:hypothetical protein